MMKILAVSALVCALMVLSGAMSVAPEEDKSTDEELLFERGACPNGWHEVGGRCLNYVAFARTWPEAEKDCQSMNGHLVSIHSVEEYRDVQKVIATVSHDFGLTWVGGSDSQQNGVWLWSDGSRFEYTNWCPGEPNNDNGQDCIQINYSGSKCWDDYKCTHRSPYVCATAASYK